MAGLNGPKIVTSGLIRLVDASQYGGWGIPETYDSSYQTTYYANNPKNLTGIAEPYYYNNQGFYPSLWTLNGIRCFSTVNGDPRIPSGPFAYLYPIIGYGTGISGNANRTYEMWFYMVSATGRTDDYGNTNITNFNLFRQGGASGWTMFGFGTRSDTQLLVHGWQADIHYVRSSSFSSILNRWVLVGASNSGNNISFYLNGESVGTGSAVLNTQDNQHWLINQGAQYIQPYGFWSGAKLYNRQLSAAEMKQNFDAQRGKYKV